MKKNIKVLICLFFILILIGGLLYFKTNIFSNNPPSSLPNDEEILLEKGVHLVSKESFVTDANILLEKGYSADEINQIYEYMSERNIKAILEHDYEDLSNFYQISNFDFFKLDRYKAYQMIENISFSDAVTRVNLKLDLPFYSEIEKASDVDSILVIVNKVYSLPSDYVPNDLVAIPSFPNLQIREVAKDDFEKLLAAATIDQVYLTPYSTYRSYDYQDGLYQKYLKEDPVEVVDTYSARPGHSEHQTGLAIDIKSNSHWYNLTESDYEWMKNNSFKYGFIIRYPKDNSFITGYKEEPWHIRYIGVEHATKLHELGITYDEYFDIYLKDSKNN